MLTAQDLQQSWRGTAALLTRRAEGLAQFDTSEAGLWTSFRALVLTAPAFVVALALARHERELEGALFGDAGLALWVAAGQAARFLALPLLAVPICRRLNRGDRFVPFVVATNWIDVFGLLLLAIPNALYLLGWETAALTRLFTIGFAAIVLHLRWFAAVETLGIGGRSAGLLTGLGLVADLALVHTFS